MVYVNVRNIGRKTFTVYGRTQTHRHAYMLGNADSLVWGSLMLAPIILTR